MGTIDNLHPFPTDKSTAATEPFKVINNDMFCILNRYAQARGTAVNVDNIFASAQRTHDACGAFIGNYGCISGILFLLTTRCIQVSPLDQEAEREVVETKHHDAEWQHQKPIRFGVALQHTEQQKVDKSTRESLPDRDL